MNPNYSIQLLPTPPRPGLYITTGPGPLVSWGLRFLTLTLLDNARVLWIDAANAFNAHFVAMTARTASKDPVQILKAFTVARPFTSYQLEAMVSEKMCPAMRRFNCVFAVIGDPLQLFDAAEGRDTQIGQSFDRFLAALVAAGNDVPVLVLQPGPLTRRYGRQLAAAAHVLTEISAEKTVTSSVKQIGWR